MTNRLLLLLACLLAAVASLLAVEYNQYDEIPLIADKIWPKKNPSESYNYFYLPVCKPAEDQSDVSQGFFHDITGSRRTKTQYDIRFGVEIAFQQLCKLFYDSKDVSLMINAVKNQYYVLMYYDDLPVKFPFGATDISQKRFFLNTHMIFHFTYNGPHVISVSAQPDPDRRVELISGEPINIEYSYSAKWLKTQNPYHNRLDKYIEMRLFPEEIEIQWFSIVNSLILVVVLTSFLAFIMMRILHRDYQYYIEDEDKDETGWKLLHADIFRFPRYPNLFTSVVGNGIQLLALSFSFLVLALLGAYYPDYSNRTMYGTLVIIYCLSTGISGYMSASYYKKLGGERWVSNILLSTVLFIGPVFLLWCVLNTIAIYYSSSAAFPFKVIVGLTFLYALVSFPLQLIGGITAKNFSPDLNTPCRTKQVPRQIPPTQWYKNSLTQFLISGLLPFSAIYIELYYVFKSMWGHIVYTPFPILFLVFLILVMVTSCITIAMTYLQISQENHEWWWRSIVNGGASAVFIFAYSIFYFFFESQMHGFLQFSFFFGYMSMICFAFFLMMASVGFLSSLYFLLRIYRGIKTD